MQKLILLLTVVISITSCTIKEKPVFIGIEDIKVANSNSKIISLAATARFKNPNDVGGNLKSDAISILINDIQLAQVNSESFDVPAKKEFTVPLNVDISTDSILSIKSSDAISSLVQSLINKQIKVQYKGNLIYKTFGFSHNYPIDKTKIITLD